MVKGRAKTPQRECYMCCGGFIGKNCAKRKHKWIVCGGGRLTVNIEFLLICVTWSLLQAAQEVRDV